MKQEVSIICAYQSPPLKPPPPLPRQGNDCFLLTKKQKPKRNEGMDIRIEGKHEKQYTHPCKHSLQGYNKFLDSLIWIYGKITGNLWRKNIVLLTYLHTIKWACIVLFYDFELQKIIKQNFTIAIKI